MRPKFQPKELKKKQTNKKQITKPSNKTSPKRNFFFSLFFFFLWKQGWNLLHQIFKDEIAQKKSSEIVRLSWFYFGEKAEWHFCLFVIFVFLSTFKIPSLELNLLLKGVWEILPFAAIILFYQSIKSWIFPLEGTVEWRRQSCKFGLNPIWLRTGWPCRIILLHSVKGGNRNPKILKSLKFQLQRGAPA